MKPDLSDPGSSEVFVAGDLALVERDGWHAGARRVAGCDSGRKSSGKEYPAMIWTSRDEAVPILEQGRSRRHRALARDCGFRKGHIQRASSVVALAVRSHHVSRRLPQSGQRVHPVGVLLHHLSTRRATHHECRAQADVSPRCSQATSLSGVSGCAARLPSSTPRPRKSVQRTSAADVRNGTCRPK